MPRLSSVESEPSLGDLLQRLALIAPEDLAAIELIVRDVYLHAERRHLLRRQAAAQDMAARYPWPTKLKPKP